MNDVAQIHRDTRLIRNLTWAVVAMFVMILLLGAGLKVNFDRVDGQAHRGDLARKRQCETYPTIRKIAVDARDRNVISSKELMDVFPPIPVACKK